MQKSLRQTEIRVGLVTLLGIIILIIGISLGKGLSVSANLKAVPIRFSGASGIENTAPVFVNGLKRGAVSSVKPDTAGVVVTVMIEDADDLRSDVSARLTILELTGGKKIEITPGKSGVKWNGSIVQGTVAPDFGDLMTFIGDISSDTKNLLKRLDTISVSLTTLLADGSFIQDIKETADNANATVASLRKILDNNRNNLEVSLQNLRTISDDLKRIVKENEPGVTALIKKLDAAANSTQNILKSADSTVARVDNLVRDVNEVVQDIRKGEGSVGKLIYDKGFAIKLDSTMTNLQLFVDQVSKHGINVNVRLGSRP